MWVFFYQWETFPLCILPFFSCLLTLLFLFFLLFFTASSSSSSSSYPSSVSRFRLFLLSGILPLLACFSSPFLLFFLFFSSLSHLHHPSLLLTFSPHYDFIFVLFAPPLLLSHLPPLLLNYNQIFHFLLLSLFAASSPSSSSLPLYIIFILLFIPISSPSSHAKLHKLHCL